MKWKEERWIYYNLFSVALQKDFYYYRVGLMLYREPELWKNFSTWLDVSVSASVCYKYFPTNDVNRCVISRSKDKKDIYIELQFNPIKHPIKGNRYLTKKYIIYDFRQKIPSNFLINVNKT